ncbi:GspH/FimT family pseudopilin [Aromatoleum diolicum]|uniref:Type II secretion system protein H n=1 Tax=Aromatoleum diolicum TaxID=75796 RepID=A0ABX1Q4I5_9RHOO|nr:GspH/FimT family pseudopilin [Aromatoleum diolicum]NMG73188.1 prepilin-type cleavage/methylation domain-containing protein [Aromatoleum diolicum]
MLKYPVRRANIAGFTLIEAMTTISILMIIVGLAGPSFEMMLARFRVRSGADTVMAGLLLARSEALRRNQPVKFTLTAGSTDWTIATVNPVSTIQAAPGGGNARLTTTTNANQTAVTFVSSGLVDTSVARLAQIDVSAGIAGINDWRIEIHNGGQTRLCDPTLTVANDPKKC